MLESNQLYIYRCYDFLSFTGLENTLSHFRACPAFCSKHIKTKFLIPLIFEKSKERQVYIYSFLGENTIWQWLKAEGAKHK